MTLRSRRPPGPEGKFLVGNWFEMRRGMLDFFQMCAREYGDIAGFSAFQVPFCLVSHPSLIKKVLVDEAGRVRKHMQTRQLRLVLGKGLVTIDGAAWREQRPAVQPLFDRKRGRRFGTVTIDRTERMTSSWADGSERHLHEDFAKLAYEITGEALLGTDPWAQWEVMRPSLSAFMDAFENAYTRRIPVPMSIPLPGNLPILRRSRQGNRESLDLVRRRMAEQAEGEDLISMLLKHRDGNGRSLSVRQVRDHVRTILLTGFESTAVALAWTVYFVSKHPNVESELMREWDRVLAGRRVAPDDVGDLRFTNQVIQESMRLHPPVWTMGREAIEPFELGGYHIRRGTQICLSQYVTHRDARFFPEPDQFRPQRWSPESAVKIPKFAFFPFGGGPRHCIGSNFAMMELCLALVTILREFHIDLIADHPIELQPSLTLRPRHGIRARVSRR